jgi:hypothetical protein
MRDVSTYVGWRRRVNGVATTGNEGARRKYERALLSSLAAKKTRREERPTYNGLH